MESLEHAIGVALAEMAPRAQGEFCAEMPGEPHVLNETAFGEYIKKELDKAGLIVSFYQEPE